MTVGPAIAVKTGLNQLVNMTLHQLMWRHQIQFQQTPRPQHIPWNKGKVQGRKAPLKLKKIWAIRFRLQESGRLRELALFNLAIDSKLRGCDLVRLRVNDVSQAGRVLARTTVVQRKTKQPIQFEIME